MRVATIARGTAIAAWIAARLDLRTEPGAPAVEYAVMVARVGDATSAKTGTC